MNQEDNDLFSEITNYYSDKCEHYLDGSNRETLAIHAGYSTDQVQDYPGSLLKMNQVLAERAGINPQDLVLDAGCGVGGSAIWMAKHLAARVIGISIVPRQLAFARKFSHEERVNSIVQFSVGDYCQAPFRKDSFDVVWALESSCYALDKNEFIREAYRLLKPGGRLIVADGFKNSTTISGEDQVLLDSWLSSWVVPNLATPEKFFAWLRESGFDRVEFHNISRNVLPFSIRLYMSALQSQMESKGISELNELSEADLDEIKGARNQMRSLIGNIWIYGIFLAVKPDKGSNG